MHAHDLLRLAGAFGPGDHAGKRPFIDNGKRQQVVRQFDAVLRDQLISVSKGMAGSEFIGCEQESPDLLFADALLTAAIPRLRKRSSPATDAMAMATPSARAGSR